MTAAPQKIYLASRSPRRRELLKQIGVAFEVLVLRDHPGAASTSTSRSVPGSSRRLRAPRLRG